MSTLAGEAAESPAPKRLLNPTSRIRALLQQALESGQVVDDLECPYEMDSEGLHFGVFESAHSPFVLVMLARPAHDYEEWMAFTPVPLAQLALSGEELARQASSELPELGLSAPKARERLAQLLSWEPCAEHMHPLGRLLD